MIQLKLKNEALYTMFFDDIPGGKSAFTADGEAHINRDEFDRFLRTNNLITYHNTIKGYEDGEVHGEFVPEGSID